MSDNLKAIIIFAIVIPITILLKFFFDSKKKDKIDTDDDPKNS